MNRKLLLQLVGIIIFVFILWKLNLRIVLALLADTRIAVLFPALVLTVPFVLLKCLRWQYLLRMQGISYDTKNSFLAYLASMYLGLVTPGRLGDFVKVIYLKNDKGVPFSTGFSSVLVDRLFDLLILISMAAAGVLAFALSWNILVIVFAFMLLFLAVIVFFTNEYIGKHVTRILFKILLPKRRHEAAEVKYSAFYSGVQQFKHPNVVYPLFLSLLTYFIFYIQCYLMAYSLGITISFLNVAFAISTANLVSLLPISISGIGTRDATLISIFSVLKLSSESALALSILFLFVSNMASCLIGAAAWFKKPVDIKKQ